MLDDLGNPREWFNYRRKRFWVLLLAVLYTLAGFFLAPWVLGRVAPDLARDYLQRDIAISKIHFNPWTLRLQVDDFSLIDSDSRDMLRFDSLIVNVQLSSAFLQTLDFYEITLNNPQILLVRYSFADTNWGQVLTNYEDAMAPEPGSEPPEADGEPLGLHITSLSINNGSLELEDALKAELFSTRIEPIGISVTDLSTKQDVSGAQNITLTTEAGMELVWTGNLQLNPLVSDGRIELSGSPLATIYRYFEKELGFTLANCCLEVAFDYNVRSLPDGNLEAGIRNGQIELSNLELDSKDSDEPILRLPLVRVSGGSLDWPEQEIAIEQLLFDKPELFLRLDRNGELNLNQMLVDSSDQETARSENAADSGAAETSGDNFPPANATDQEPVADESATPWNIALGELRVDEMLLALTDRSLKLSEKPGSLDLRPINLSVRDISSAAGSTWPINLDIASGTGGTISFAGNLIALPEIEASGQLDINALQLQGFQPWITEAAQIRLDSGELNLTGTIQSAPAETLALAGDVRVADLGITDTSRDESLLGWQNLNLLQTEFALDANTLLIGTVEIIKPFARVNIAEDGSTNFASLGTETAAVEAETEETATTTVEEGEPLTVRVGKTSLENGSVDFSDMSLPLPFRALISEFEGTMSAIDSNSQQPSKLDFEGRVGEFGQTTLTGDVSVMAPTEQTDVQLVFRNLSMPDLSPYTAEFVGRKIDSGKLDLDLNYTLEQQKLVGANNIVIRDFSLGDNIESANAMSLPLDLAIALLTDANGVIDLDLNVSGDLDDPSFSASGIVLKAFGNLITKAVTAPFKLLGGLVPGGSDLDLEAIEFEPGTADLSPPEREKLTQISAGMGQRPALRLQIDGGYNTSIDAPALQKINLDNQLATLVDDSAGADEYTRDTRKALEKLAKQQLPDLSLRELREEFKLPDPETGKRNFDELAYSAELRARLEAIQPADNESLQVLARQRRDMMLAYLNSLGELDETRVAVGELVEAETGERGWVRVPLAVQVAE